jgi:hypothetical protein
VISTDWAVDFPGQSLLLLAVFAASKLLIFSGKNLSFSLSCYVRSPVWFSTEFTAQVFCRRPAAWLISPRPPVAHARWVASTGSLDQFASDLSTGTYLCLLDSFWPEDSRSLLIFHCRSSLFLCFGLPRQGLFLLLPLLSPISLHVAASRACSASRFGLSADRFLLHEVVAQLILWLAIFVGLFNFCVDFYVTWTRFGHIFEPSD